MNKNKVLRWGLVEVALLSWALSCGRVDDPRGDGDATDDLGSGGGVIGATGGVSNSGGGSSGVIPAAGGGSDLTPDPGTCANIPESLLSPPCSDEDIIVPGSCGFDSWLNLSVPATDLAVPTEVLHLSLLSTEPPLGFGGEGGGPGAVPALRLPVYAISPSSAGKITDTAEGDFVLTAEGASILTGFDLNQSAGYFEEFQTDSPEWGRETYTVVWVAIAEGGTILSERRVIFEPTLQCIVR